MNRAGPAPREPADRLAVSRRRIAVNFLTLAGTNVFGLLVTILISVYVRRAMGPEAIRQVSWAIATIAYLTALVSPGLTFVGQRELAQSPERSQSFIALVLSLQTLWPVSSTPSSWWRHRSSRVVPSSARCSPSRA